MDRQQRVFKMAFASVHPHYVEKAEKKGRTKKEVDEVICWLTGYTPRALATQIKQRKDFQTFFSEAPALNPNASKITGVVCGVRLERIVRIKPVWANEGNGRPVMRSRLPLRQQERLAWELAKPRRWKVLDYGLKAMRQVAGASRTGINGQANKLVRFIIDNRSRR